MYRPDVPVSDKAKLLGITASSSSDITAIIFINLPSHASDVGASTEMRTHIQTIAHPIGANTTVGLDAALLLCESMTRKKMDYTGA